MEIFTLKPEKIESDDLVKLLISEQEIICSIRYYDENFYRLMKDYGFTWCGNKRKWTKKTVVAVILDRISEIGNALLNEGFIVSLDNQEVVEKIKNQSFEPEPTRLIDVCRVIGYENYLKIVWIREDLYKCVRYNLYGSSYLKDYQLTIVPLCFYQEIYDFAADYDFLITEAAGERIEAGKKDIFVLFNLEPPKIKKTTVFHIPQKIKSVTNTIDDSLKD